MTNDKEKFMSTHPTDPVGTSDIYQARWRIDPARSSVAFHVPQFYGLSTVKGRFERYDGTLSLSRQPAIELTIDAASLGTNNRLRDAHLRSRDFFHIKNHPQVRFVADSATLNGERLKVSGRLHATGNSIPVDVDATLRRDGDSLDIEATAYADHRQLGMTRGSLLSVIGTPSKLIVRGKLTREDS